MNSVENVKPAKVVAIVGPTASGKTSLSVELAEHFSGEIISADSRQVYRGLDIGTEKITPEEMRGVPHHLIDVADPAEAFTAADFKRLGEQALWDILMRSHVPFVVGGTGFYVQALLDGIVLPEVPANEKLRRMLEHKETNLLFEELRARDPDRAASIDPHNRRRLIRALEIIETLGAVPRPVSNVAKYEVLYLGIETPDHILKERIAQRLENQLQRGLLDEVGTLLQQLPRERINELGYEYRLAADFIENVISMEEFQSRLITELWQYAKRQRTWFKRDKRITWFTLEQKKKFFSFVEQFLEGGR